MSDQSSNHSKLTTNIANDAKTQPMDVEKRGTSAEVRTQLVNDDENLARDSGVKPAFIAKVRSWLVVLHRAFTHL